MTRLAVPILILLLMLFAGAVWLLAVYLDLPQLAGKPPADAPSVSEQLSPRGADELAQAEAPTAGEQPEASFDIARIDPQGTSVFAGRAEPGATVTIMGDGEAVGTAEADENGEWTLATEHLFSNADPKLALAVKSAAETKAEKGAQTHVAGSLEAREAAKEPQKGQAAGTPAGDLLKSFEGIVAAARTEAEQDKKEASNEPAKVDTEAKSEVETSEEKPEPASPDQGQQKEKKVVVAEPPLAPETPPPTPSTAGKSESTPGKSTPGKSEEPPEKSATSPSAPSAAPPARLAATTPEPPTPRKSIPVPITFVYNEATFTSDGRKAVSLLLEYLQLKNFPRISLTGHADERGTHEYNLDLSRERLDAVARYLKDGGYEGNLELVPKGETEPFAGVARSKYSKEDLYQLDRRVELFTTP